MYRNFSTVYTVLRTGQVCRVQKIATVHTALQITILDYYYAQMTKVLFFPPVDLWAATEASA